MGNKIEREQLYEDNMQLKDIINNLRRELAEVKNKLVKKDIEIRKKEKLIKECSKEKLIEYFSIIINNSISSVIKAFNEKRTTNEQSISGS